MKKLICSLLLGIALCGYSQTIIPSGTSILILNSPTNGQSGLEVSNAINGYIVALTNVLVSTPTLVCVDITNSSITLDGLFLGSLWELTNYTVRSIFPTNIVMAANKPIRQDSGRIYYDDGVAEQIISNSFTAAAITLGTYPKFVATNFIIGCTDGVGSFRVGIKPDLSFVVVTNN